jgi:hypothetical protein
VGVVAQAVQHSAYGSAYGQWEESAGVMSRVLTGVDPAGLSCVFQDPTPARRADLTELADVQLGAGALRRTTGTAAADWAVAHWLVGHAQPYGVVGVSVRGRRWLAATGEWTAAPRAPRAPRVVFYERR